MPDEKNKADIVGSLSLAAEKTAAANRTAGSQTRISSALMHLR